jgi:diacylglycerol kinase
MVGPVNDDPKRKTHTEIDDGLLGTVKIDPDRYSSPSNTSPVERVKYAVAGLLHLLVHHTQFIYIVVTTGVVYGLAWWLGASLSMWAVLTVALGQVWLAEIFNTALESLTDLTTEGSIRSLAKVTKDVAATGTFVASGVLLIVCGTTLLPLFLARF